jgi:hypothetical protein
MMVELVEIHLLTEVAQVAVAQVPLDLMAQAQV